VELSLTNASLAASNEQKAQSRLIHIVTARLLLNGYKWLLSLMLCLKLPGMVSLVGWMGSEGPLADSTHKKEEREKWNE
jgi:hypothetical protein